MNVLWLVIGGFIVGVIAKLLYPGRQGMGLVMTTLLGIAGSVGAGYAGQALGLYQAGQGAGFIGSLLGALALLFIYGRLKR